MKTINQDKHSSNIKCEGCGEYFEADDLDMVSGKWLCRICEDLHTK